MGQTNRGGKPDGREEDGAGAGVFWQEFGGDPRSAAPVAGAAGGKVGLSRQQVYRYEQGLAFEPLHSTVERVASFAGVSQEQLTHALLREGDIHVDGR